MKGIGFMALCLAGWLCCVPASGFAATDYVIDFKGGGSIKAVHYVDKGESLVLYLSSPEGFMEVQKSSVAGIRRPTDIDAEEMEFRGELKKESGAVSRKPGRGGKGKEDPLRKQCARLDSLRQEAMTYCAGVPEAFKKGDEKMIKTARSRLAPSDNAKRLCDYYTGLVRELEAKCR